MKQPATSTAAYKEAKKGLIETDQQKIITALSTIGVGNYQDIAAAAKMDKIACMRRLSELERDGKVYKPGTTSKTKSGRHAYNYSVTEDYVKKVEKPVEVKAYRAGKEVPVKVIGNTIIFPEPIF